MMIVKEILISLVLVLFVAHSNGNSIQLEQISEIESKIKTSIQSNENSIVEAIKSKVTNEMQAKFFWPFPTYKKCEWTPKGGKTKTCGLKHKNAQVLGGSVLVQEQKGIDFDFDSKAILFLFFDLRCKKKQNSFLIEKKPILFFSKKLH